MPHLLIHALFYFSLMAAFLATSILLLFQGINCTPVNTQSNSRSDLMKSLPTTARRYGELRTNKVDPGQAILDQTVFHLRETSRKSIVPSSDNEASFYKKPILKDEKNPVSPNDGGWVILKNPDTAPRVIEKQNRKRRNALSLKTEEKPKVVSTSTGPNNQDDWILIPSNLKTHPQDTMLQGFYIKAYHNALKLLTSVI